ncbi:ATP-dependent helicase [Candidatus Clostridium radicumherbarum]|uniref:DNA 3'-5' helicase n=1 Tax=Candidatus Clostridium radicumherbarum TaxID=3381662 RepID=A0ABW8TQE4_9CLOT
MLNQKILREFYSLRDKIIEADFSYLDKEQRSAVLSNDRNVIVSACPGSGKTTVLINKVLYLVKYGLIYKSNYIPKNLSNEVIELMKIYLQKGKEKLREEDIRLINANLTEKGINPNNIIVITFTKAAAENMKKRFQNLSCGRKAPFFGTFHGLFYKLLIRNEGQIKIIEGNEAFKIISNTLTRYTDEVSEEKVNEIRNYISVFKVSNTPLEDFDPNIDRSIFIKCFSAYEEYKNTHNLLDFDDLQINFKKLLVKSPKVLSTYRKSFHHILVDEFQDCDEMQMQVLTMLNETNSIFAVGDEDQCIYSFRGSRPEFMVNFGSMFEKGKSLFLSTNYRSTENIINISNTLIKNNVNRNIKNMFSSKNEKKKIESNNFYDENSEGDFIANEIEALNLRGGYSYKDHAVLFRTNMESRSIVDALLRKKLPFKLLDKEYNFFEHFICKDIIAYLRLSIFPDDAQSFIRVINKPFRYISKISLEKLKECDIKGNCFEAVKNMETTPIFQMKNLDKLYKSIAHLNKMTLEGAAQSIIHDLGYEEHIVLYCKKFKLKLSDLLDIIEEFKESVKPYSTIIAFLSHVEAVKEELKKVKNNFGEEDAVILSTIHGVKGMEFKNVFIMNCVEDLLPHKNSIEEGIEEERRLFYVGITRAIDNIYFCIPQNIRGSHKLCSRFIEEIDLNSAGGLKPIYNNGDTVVHQSFGKGKVMEFKDNVIEIAFEEGIARKFDVNILHNNGLLKKLS